MTPSRPDFRLPTMASSGTHLPLPPVPASLKPVAHYLKTATEHENRDPVIAYWSRLAALQNGMRLDRSSTEAKAILLPLMNWLEAEKKVLAGNEAITNDLVASAHIENHAMKLFTWADQQDREGHFNKNVVKAFYTANILFDVLTVFGELTPENIHARKYAKWKAAYIHNCLKNGERPIPGPMGGVEGVEDEALGPPPGVEAMGWNAPELTPQIPPEAAPVKPTPSPRGGRSDPPPPEAEASPECGLSQAQLVRTQKLCKYASSALDYEDTATAIENLQKALRLLQTGAEA
eukprot:snap_masked-scaffold631_size122145-processed-gene-0.18 protein:Tk01060 transcript:snap_masked-scaffold631_size122145-processed-gene-0.18-mRNA-1 annotation:"vacuolar protein sorting-associated protein vta1-like protein"